MSILGFPGTVLTFQRVREVSDVGVLDKSSSFVRIASPWGVSQGSKEEEAEIVDTEK